MKYKKTDFTVFIKISALCITIFVIATCIFKQWYWGLGICLLAFIFQVRDFFIFHKKAEDEVEDFVESIHYRDFSRHFNVKHAPLELQPLRQGFNEINTTFKSISKEKETQYQYLQKVLEIVDTGILSYEIKSGEIVWMNESLKKLLQIPYLKNIQSLDKRDANLCTQIVNLSSGEKVISTIHQERKNIKVVISATAFQTDNIQYKLIAFQNVNEALDETEAKAWQKLLSVMTHEIMNSVAPIASLAGTLQTMLKQPAGHTFEQSAEIKEDIELGIDTIKKRSEGLLKFTETYRSLNKITKANLTKIYVSELLENLNRLMLPTIQQKNIHAEIILKDPLLTINADAGLIEQVLINLMLNAIDAVKTKNNPIIQLSAYIDSDNKTVIKLADNGAGMNEDVLDKIFVPFFSTKKNGNGIGLSLCKQIMLAHKGSIQVHSIPDEGTVFTLIF